MTDKVSVTRILRRILHTRFLLTCLAVIIVWHNISTSRNGIGDRVETHNGVGNHVKTHDAHLDFTPVHVHVVVRTYDKATISTIANLGSILAAASVVGESLKLSIAILDTSQGCKSNTLHEMLLSIIHALSITTGRTLDIAIREYVHEGSESYGYVASDLELSRIKSWNHPPDYVIFCNGDTYYAQEFFLLTLPSMRQKIHLIGVDWVPTMRHLPAQKKFATKLCKFEHGGVDLNGVLINVKALISVNASFDERKTPCKSLNSESRRIGCKAIDTRPYFVADWGLFSLLLEHPDTSLVCVGTRPLFFQN